MNKIEKLIEEYEKVLGVEYVFQVGILMTDEERMEELEHCIKTQTRQILEEYDDECDY